MQARMDTQQQRLDSRGFAGCDGGGNPTLQRALAERRAARDEPAGSKRGASTDRTLSQLLMTMMLAFSFLFNFFCFV
ncbi:hypothetical protein Bca52824_065740 [Brassica carinata]|uniref:Uncharacterized protein n=1 Tax=Brassica carinata TaxID=52824 RepID=A0A8X7U9F4_BRACI|nr:hypothetical protein Bca52824_065740 [Brassica carinata]